MNIRISKTAVDSYLWQVEKWLYEHYGIDAGNRMMSPLYWYIETGRGSSDFLKSLIACKPFVIGRILAKGGSDDNVLKAIKKRIRA